MGQMRFYVPVREQVPPASVERAVLVGYDGIPWFSRNAWEGECLVVRRDEADSGNLVIPWSVPERGELMLSTGSLMERSQPYHLPLELARGTLNRLRGQVAGMREARMDVPDLVAASLAAAEAAFITAATSQHDGLAAAAAAGEVIRLAVEAGDRLTHDLARQVLAIRQSQSPQLATLIAARLDPDLKEPQAEQLIGAINSGLIAFDWSQLQPEPERWEWSSVDRQLEWASQRGLRVLAGPLLELERARLPDWLYLWSGDFERIRTFVAEYIREATLRYAGRVQVWHTSARLNVASELELQEDEVLRLAVDAIETTRHSDPRTPVILSFDQPWADYLAGLQRELSPLHFADALVRAELGVSGLGLELDWGYQPHGTALRDLLELGRLLDRWSLLALPLIVQLTMPSAPGDDPRARRPDRAATGHPACGGTAERQQEYLEQLMTVIASKPSVQAIIWNQCRDAVPHELAHGGLFDAQDQAKPMVEVLTTLRRAYFT